MTRCSRSISQISPRERNHKNVRRRQGLIHPNDQRRAPHWKAFGVINAFRRHGFIREFDAGHDCLPGLGAGMALIMFMMAFAVAAEGPVGIHGAE
jgi:hypothetical protein